MGLMSGGTPAVGGYGDEADLFIEPTVLTQVSVISLMTDEIFGPHSARFARR